MEVAKLHVKSGSKFSTRSINLSKIESVESIVSPFEESLEYYEDAGFFWVSDDAWGNREERSFLPVVRIVMDSGDQFDAGITFRWHKGREGVFDYSDGPSSLDLYSVTGAYNLDEETWASLTIDDYDEDRQFFRLSVDTGRRIS